MIGGDDITEHVELSEGDLHRLCEQGPDNTLVVWWGGKGSEVCNEFSLVRGWEKMLNVEVFWHGNWCGISGGFAHCVDQAMVIVIVFSFLQEDSNNRQSIGLAECHIKRLIAGVPEYKVNLSAKLFSVQKVLGSFFRVASPMSMELSQREF